MKNLPTWAITIAFIKYYILLPFSVMEYGAIKYKIGAIFLTSLLVSPLAWFSEFIRDNIIFSPKFAVGLVILLLADLLAGVIKHLKLHTFDWAELFKGVSVKIAITIMGMAVFKSLANFEEFDSLPSIRDYIILVGKIGNFLYIGGSAFNNMYIVTGGKFPPMAWMQRMKKFSNDLNVSSLVKESKDSIEELAKENTLLKELLEEEKKIQAKLVNDKEEKTTEDNTDESKDTPDDTHEGLIK